MSTSGRERATSQDFVSEDECDYVDGVVAAAGPKTWNLTGQRDVFLLHKNNDSLNRSKDSLENHKSSSVVNLPASVDPLPPKISTDNFDAKVDTTNGANTEEFINGRCPLCHCSVVVDDVLAKAAPSNLVSKSNTSLLSFASHLDVYSGLYGAESLASDSQNFHFPKGVSASQNDISRTRNERRLCEKIDICPLCTSKVDGVISDRSVDSRMNDALNVDYCCGSQFCTEDDVGTSRQAVDFDDYAGTCMPFERSKYRDGVEGRWRFRNQDGFDLARGLFSDQGQVYDENHLGAEDEIVSEQTKWISSGQCKEKSFDKDVQCSERKNCAKCRCLHCSYADDENEQDFQRVAKTCGKQQTQEISENLCQKYCRDKIVECCSSEIELQNKNDCRNETLENRNMSVIYEEVKTKSKAAAAKRKRRKKNKGKKIATGENHDPPMKHIVEASEDKSRDSCVEETEGKSSLDGEKEIELNQEFNEDEDKKTARDPEKCLKQENVRSRKKGKVKAKEIQRLKCAIEENKSKNFDRSGKTNKNQETDKADESDVNDFRKDSEKTQDDTKSNNLSKDVRGNGKKSKLEDKVIDRNVDVKTIQKEDEKELKVEYSDKSNSEVTSSIRNVDVKTIQKEDEKELKVEYSAKGNSEVPSSIRNNETEFVEKVELETLVASQTDCQDEGTVEEIISKDPTVQDIVQKAEVVRTESLQDRCEQEEIPKNSERLLSENRNVEINSVGNSSIDLELPISSTSSPNGISSLLYISESDKCRFKRELVLRQKNADFNLSFLNGGTANGIKDGVRKCEALVSLGNKSSLKILSDFQEDLHASKQKPDSFNLSSVPQDIDEPSEWNGIPEKFLVPTACISSRNITTPQEDLGFAKVPGYRPRLKSMEEETEEVADVPQLSSNDRTEDVEADLGQSQVEKFVTDTDSSPVKTVENCSPDGVDSSKLGLGAQPKEQFSACSARPEAVLPSSPRPSAPLKSARPNSLIGLSKPDVNLPCLKFDFSARESRDDEKSLSCGFIPFPDGSAPQRKRFTFSSVENFISADFNDITPFRFDLKAKTEASDDKSPSKVDFSSLDGDKSTHKFKEKSTLSPFPPPSMNTTPAKRPTSWSQSLPNPARSLSVLPKRPNSLNITASNSLSVNIHPVRGLEHSTEDLKDGRESSLNPLKIKVKAPCSLMKESTEESVTMVDRVESRLASELVLERKSHILSDERPTSRTGDPDKAPPISSNINLRITDLGKVAPLWVPDSEAPRCMHCDSRFTFTRRRHHCRACGKVFCSGCCNLRMKLFYLDSKEARVCSRCYQDLICAQLYENSAIEFTTQTSATDIMARTHASGEPAAITVSKKESVEQKRAPADHVGSRYDVAQLATDANELKTSPINGNKVNSLSSQEINSTVEVSERALPSFVWRDRNGLKFDVALMSESSSPSVVRLLPNLQVNVSVINLDCCMGRTCWCFVTRGLCTVGQDEVVYVLERLPEETQVPSDIFSHICELYDRAFKGDPVGFSDHTLVAEGRPFLDSTNHAGFLYVQPTFQCLRKLPLPPYPYLFGILVHRAEVPWVRVFPIRLLLRLGAEYRYYPCPLVSIRFREPVFRDIGHTIMNLLVDLRNFKYRLPHIDGLVVHMEDKRTYVNLPRSRYPEIKRAFNSNSDHVLALEANFCHFGDSHLVCFQNPEGKYITQAINIQNRPRKTTGASFIIFNGALKPASGMHAKCSIVEDGLMVQVSPDSMRELKVAVSNAEDYCIGCGQMSLLQPEEWVVLKWIDDNDTLKQRSVNKISSPIDGALLDRSRCRRIRATTDHVTVNSGVRCTEIYYFGDDEMLTCRSTEKSDFEGSVAQTCCSIFNRHLDSLQLPALTRIAVRVTTGPDKSMYKIGTNCRYSIDVCNNDLDQKLLPLLEKSPEATYTFELFFYVIEHEPLWPVGP